MFTKEFNEVKEIRYLLELERRKEFYKDVPDVHKAIVEQIEGQRKYIEDNR
jgi:hypothetical protein